MLLNAEEIMRLSSSRYFHYCLDNFQGEQNHTLMGQAIGSSLGIIRNLPTAEEIKYLLLTSDKIISFSQVVSSNSSVRELLYNQDHKKFTRLLENDETGTVKQCMDLCLLNFKEDIKVYKDKKKEEKLAKITLKLGKSPLETILEERDIENELEIKGTKGNRPSTASMSLDSENSIRTPSRSPSPDNLVDTLKSGEKSNQHNS